jgi:hypothetical protein
MVSSWMLRRVAPCQNRRFGASFMRVPIRGELGTTIAVTRTRQLALFLVHRFLSPL